MTSVKQNTKRIQTLISKLKISKENKEEMILSFSDGRTTHVSELDEHEGNAVYAHLYKLQNSPAANDDRDIMDRMRKKIISKFREMDFNIYDAGKGCMVADMIRIEEKMVEKFGKLLNEYSKDELEHIIGVLETKWLPWYYKNKKDAED